jgi:peptidoglycan/xylan/chitin deacetylase (PgdA/CDA1 family)
MEHWQWRATVKSAVRQVLTHRSLGTVWRTFAPTTVFFSHRYVAPGASGELNDPKVLKPLLERLRRERFTFPRLDQIVGCVADSQPLPRRAVAFTVDDGYRDFEEIAPVYAAYDVPVTVFVSTGFLDGACWMWWDRIAYATRHSACHELHIELDGEALRYQWTDVGGAHAAATDFVERLQWVPRDVREARTTEAFERLGVTPPDKAPEEYAAMSWDDVRSYAKMGIKFGPHTVTHPILAETPAEDSAWEIEESWRRLKEETDETVSVFCYPHGGPRAFGPREAETVRRLGMLGAVSTGHRHPNPSGDAFAVPRYPCPDRGDRLLLMAYGIQ